MAAKLKNMVALRLFLIATVLSVCSFSVSSFAQHNDAVEPALTVGEYEVYAAVVDFFVSNNIARHPLIANRTSTFECGSPHNGMNMGGCNGLQAGSETPQQRMETVQRNLPQLEANAVADFMSKNSKTAWIDAKLPTKHKYLMFGLAHSDPIPPGWEHADFFFFSRVGFNVAHTQALIHVSFISGTNAADSCGKYVLFRKVNGRWEREGSSVVWELEPHKTT